MMFIEDQRNERTQFLEDRDIVRMRLEGVENRKALRMAAYEN